MSMRRPAAALGMAVVLGLQGCAAARGPEPVAATSQAPATSTAPGPAQRKPLPAGPKEAAGPGRGATRGLAAWSRAAFHGKTTASGERFDMNDMTAAHPTLPFGTLVEVRSLVNGRTVQVRINDRGPHTGRRIIDLSRAAAEALGMRSRGVKLVQLRVLELGTGEPQPPASSQAATPEQQDARQPQGQANPPSR